MPKTETATGKQAKKVEPEPTIGSWRGVDTFVAICLALAVAGGLVLACWGSRIPPPPPGMVGDRTHTLDAPSKGRIVDAIASLEARTGVPMAVYLDNFDDDLIERALELSDGWGLDGVLLLIDVQGRRMRLQVAPRLRSTITDARAQEILDDKVREGFRSHDFEAGVLAAVTGVDAIVSTADRSALGQRRTGAHRTFPTTRPAMGLALALPFGALLWRLRRRRRRAAVLASWGLGVACMMALAVLGGIRVWPLVLVGFSAACTLPIVLVRGRAACLGCPDGVRDFAYRKVTRQELTEMLEHGDFHHLGFVGETVRAFAGDKAMQLEMLKSLSALLQMEVTTCKACGVVAKKAWASGAGEHSSGSSHSADSPSSSGGDSSGGGSPSSSGGGSPSSSGGASSSW